MRLPWIPAREKDPYWDFFLNAAPSDPDNQINNALQRARQGAVFPVKSDIHSPEVMSAHVKELGRFFGAQATGIVRLSGAAEDRFAIVCVVPADHDPRVALGAGGQAPVTQGLFVSFNIAAVLREWGVRASTIAGLDGERLAAAAGLGSLNGAGRLVTPRFGAKVYVPDVIRTELELLPDGEIDL